MSRRLSLNELFAITEKPQIYALNYHLLGDIRAYDDEEFPFWKEYSENPYEFDSFQALTKGHFLFIRDLDDDDLTALSQFHRWVRSYIYTNKESINRIYAALKAEYNILDNYNGTETETVTSSGSGTSSIGAQTSSNTTGAQTSTTTSSTSPWNEGGNFTEAEKTSEDAGARTDSANVGARDDSSSFSNSETRTLTRHGNLGVTTSQQMIDSELRLRFQNAFFDKLWEMIVVNMFIFCDEGYDPF